MHNAIKKFIKIIVASSRLYQIDKNKYIVLFHDIANSSDYHFSEEYSILPEKFFKIMDLVERKFDLLSVDQIVSSETKVGKKPLAAIMFDDGFYSVRDIAFPYLKDRNIPFTVSVNKRAVTKNRLWFTDLAINDRNNGFWDFVREELRLGDGELNRMKKMQIFEFFIQYSDVVMRYDIANEQILSKDNKIFCDEADLKQMLNSNIVSVNSHSNNHYMLTKCTEEQIENDIKENKKFVEEITAKTEEYFTLPFGKTYSCDNRVVAACVKYGYKYIFTTTTEYFNNNDLKSNPVFIPRIGIDNGPVSGMMFNINMSIINKRL